MILALLPPNIFPIIFEPEKSGKIAAKALNYSNIELPERNWI
jgi:hypothetical protein